MNCPMLRNALLSVALVCTATSGGAAVCCDMDGVASPNGIDAIWTLLPNIAPVGGPSSPVAKLLYQSQIGYMNRQRTTWGYCVAPFVRIEPRPAQKSPAKPPADSWNIAFGIDLVGPNVAPLEFETTQVAVPIAVNTTVSLHADTINKWCKFNLPGPLVVPKVYMQVDGRKAPVKFNPVPR